jgi:Ca2+-binding RTX toxin-like protein
MAPTITLIGDYGYSSYRLTGSDADLIDASAALWTLANIGSRTNLYPFQVVDADADLVIVGGTINGQVSLTLDWIDAYVNSAAVRIEDAARVTIQDWRISQPWDGIRLKGGSNGFTIENVWLSDVRDDAIENDDGLGGTIRDSLFDGVFVGISTHGNGGGAGNVVTLDGVLMRMESYLYRDKVTHQSPFKADPAGGNPEFRVIDSVIAIERVDHDGQNRLAEAFSEMTEVKNSYYLNLSEVPLPKSYPAIPAGFTLLQGQAARDFWAKAKADWIESRDDVDGPGDPDPLNPIPGGEGAEWLRGTAGRDDIAGNGGNDRLFGKEGEDILTGGAGGDRFVFDTKPGAGNLDTITDFTPGQDWILLDNNVFGKLGPGSWKEPKPLASSLFQIGRADDATDHMLYDPRTGSLSYDRDGSGSAAAVEVARLGLGLALDYDDFLIV